MSKVLNTEILEDPRLKDSKVLEITFGKEKKFSHDPNLCSSCNSGKITNEEFKLCSDCYESRRDAMITRIKFFVVCDKISSEIESLGITTEKILQNERNKKSLHQRIE